MHSEVAYPAGSLFGQHLKTEKPNEAFAKLCGPPRSKRASLHILDGYDRAARVCFQAELTRTKPANSLLIDGAFNERTQGPPRGRAAATVQRLVESTRNQIYNCLNTRNNAIIINADGVVVDHRYRPIIEIADGLSPADAGRLHFVTNQKEVAQDPFFTEGDRLKRFQFLLVEKIPLLPDNLHSKIMDLVDELFGNTPLADRAIFSKQLQSLISGSYSLKVEALIEEAKRAANDLAARPVLDGSELARLHRKMKEKPWAAREVWRMSPFDFVKLHFGEWLGHGLTQAHLGADPSLYQALRTWKMKHGQPKDIDLPARVEVGANVVDGLEMLVPGVPARVLLAAGHRARRNGKT